MAWAETFPIPGSRFVSLFRTDFNNIIDALVTVQLGPLEPEPLYAGMLWADTNQGFLKQRRADNTGWTIRGQLEVDYGGALTMAGTGGTPMTGLLDMGGFPITNVGLGTGNSAARVADLVAYLKANGTTSLTGLLRQGGAAAGLNPTNADDLTRKGYVDASRLAGGVYTGKITMPFAPTAGTNELVRQVDLETVRDGHVHNGALGQGQKINIGNLGATSQGAYRFPRAGGANNLVLSVLTQRPLVFLDDCPTVVAPPGGSGTPVGSGWIRTNLVPWIAETGANAPYAAILNVTIARIGTGGSFGRVEFKKIGTLPGGAQRVDLDYDIPDGDGGQRVISMTQSVFVEIDPTTREFDYRMTGNVSVWLRLVAYMRQTSTD